MMTIVNTKGAPGTYGPYSQATVAGNFVFVSGQLPLNPLTGELVTSGIKAETSMVMENIRAILLEAGIGFENVVKTSLFLSDLQNFAQVNEVYGTYFTANFPARETVQVAALPKGANIEMSVIAIK